MTAAHASARNERRHDASKGRKSRRVNPRHRAIANLLGSVLVAVGALLTITGAMGEVWTGVWIGAPTLLVGAAMLIDANRRVFRRLLKR